ncbi:MAG: DNA replication/repair protein RecF [Alkalinema sp. RU_4_3]|nr:DNA replication/repair protein RecF [Alkalinema sp. RU_4_3]
MYLKNLHLQHFRNYPEQSIEFTGSKTILLGENAQGKSNLLEAVELLSVLRSHRTSRDRDLVREGEEVARLVANLKREDRGNLEMGMVLRGNGRRSVALNGVGLRRQLDFLGVLNMVQFSSLDLDLVRGGPEMRRHWLDGLLVQLEPIYAHLLQQYGQILKQRNALLKAIRQGKVGFDPEQMALWDAQLATTGTRLARRRSRLLQRLNPIADRWHQAISGGSEHLNLTYAPKFDFVDTNAIEDIRQAFLVRLQQKAIAEQQQGTSLVGPHRDEVVLTINQTPAREYGSQGQQRTLVLALKLAELELIEAVTGETPLLLLDDVLAELDLQRQNQLLDAIQDRVQTIITTTHLGSFDAQWLSSAQIFQVENGTIVGKV